MIIQDIFSRVFRRHAAAHEQVQDASRGTAAAAASVKAAQQFRKAA